MATPRSPFRFLTSSCAASCRATNGKRSHRGAALRNAGAEVFVQGRADHVMPTTLFTLGYQQRSIDEFVAILGEHEIDVLIDVRETAWSHKPGFSKSAFAAALAGAGVEYVHADFAGNPKWLRSNADSHGECLELYDRYLDDFAEIVRAFDRLVAELHAAGKRVCITCFERHADDCHRAILAHRWKAKRGRQVRHLAVEGCRRLQTA